MDFDQIIQELKNKIYHPVYFLCGEEPYYTDKISDYIENNVLDEAAKGFNQYVFYGRDTEARTVVETALRFPMMSNHQVIIVKEAQNWKDMEPLNIYLKNPAKSTILVINYKYKKLDGRTELSRLIKKNALYFESIKKRDYEIPGWINDYVRKNNYEIMPQATQMLADFLGEDLSRIVNELNKLFIIIPQGVKITPDHVERNIGISKEFNAFELNNALGNRDILKANRIVAHFAANPKNNPMNMILGTLTTYFTRLFRYHFLADKSERSVMAQLRIQNAFIAKKTIAEARRYTPTKLFEIIGILREYDMKSKGLESTGDVTDGELLKEMVYRILH